MAKHIDIKLAKMRTKIKASKSKIASAQGGNSTTRMTSKLNVAKTTQAFDAERMTKLTSKSTETVKNSAENLKGRKAGSNIKPNFTRPDKGPENLKTLNKQAKKARAKGGTSTSRIKSSPSKIPTLTKLANIAKKSRSPVLIAFGIGLNELLKPKKAKKINAGPI